MTTEVQTEQLAEEQESSRGGKFLTFTLSEEEYGLEIMKVREIIGIMDITAVPRMPQHVKGVINLRGKVIPVVDLRLKFSMPPTEYTEATCIIVVDVGALVGIVVDTVQEVLDIEDAQIDSAPPLGASVDTSFIMGMGKVKEDVKILLDINKVLTEETAFATSDA